MSKLFEVGRRLWERFQWGASPLLERTLMPRLYELEELVVPLVKPHLDVYELQGQGKGSPLKVTYVGLDYGKWYLKSVMFTEEPEEIAKEPVSVWRPDEVAYAPDSDIVIVAASERLICRLPCQNTIVLPLYVQNILDIRGDWEDVENRLRRSNSVRNDFRWFKKYDYTYEISHDDRDLEMYYHTMYLPMMEERHGDVAHIVSKEEARQHLRHGCLFLVKRDGCIVAGGLCRAQGGKITLITVGVAGVREQLMKEGVVGALYISLFRWANQAGYKAFDFLGCPPYLRMGISRFKRKWGTTVSIPPNSHKQVWFRFQCDTPAVRQFLKDNPCAIIDEKGGLHGLVVIDDAGNITPEAEAHYYKQYFATGMKGLLIRSVADLLREPGGELGAVKHNLVQEQYTQRI
jgi:hypothetical protein